MFEIKYDKNNMPLPNQQPPVFEEKEQESAPQAEESTQETTQNLENLQEMTQEIEQEQEDKEEPTPAKPSYPEKQNDRNVRALREKAKRADELERERDELMRAYIAMQNKTQGTPAPAEEEEFNIAPDDLVEGKHLSKIERKYQKKLEELEKKYAGYEQKSQEMAIENRIKSSYPDFDKVVSAENIDYLRENEPELAQTLNSSSDLYSKAVSAYKLIKRLGIYQEDTFEKDRALAQKNAAKPKSVNTIAPQQGESPLSNANAFANGLTKDLKNKLWAEMNEIRKNN